MCKEKCYCRPLFWVYQNCHTCYFVSQNCNKCYISRQNFTLRKHRHCETQTVKFIRNQQESCLFMNRINKVVIQRRQQDRGLKHKYVHTGPRHVGDPTWHGSEKHQRGVSLKTKRIFSSNEENCEQLQIACEYCLGCHFLHIIYFPAKIPSLFQW